MRRFGFKLFYGDASRIDLLEAAGAREAQVLIVAVDDRDKISEIVAAAQKNFPNLRIFTRVFDRVHAYEMVNAGVKDHYREVFDSSLSMAEDALVALGTHPYEAHRAAKLFKAHDEERLVEAAQHVGDTEAIIDIVRKSRAEITNVLDADRKGNADQFGISLAGGGAAGSIIPTPPAPAGSPGQTTCSPSRRISAAGWWGR